jgi:hypothetical protein
MFLLWVDESRGKEEAKAFKYFNCSILWRDKLVSPMDSFEKRVGRRQQIYNIQRVQDSHQAKAEGTRKHFQ